MNIKNPRQLADVIGLALPQGSEEMGKVIAAGMITRQPGTMPLRVVLVAFAPPVIVGSEGQFIVYTEIFQEDDDDDFDLTTNLENGCSSSFSHGEYFQADEYQKAYSSFVYRCGQQLKGNIESIARNIQGTASKTPNEANDDGIYMAHNGTQMRCQRRIRRLLSQTKAAGV